MNDPTPAHHPPANVFGGRLSISLFLSLVLFGIAASVSASAPPRDLDPESWFRLEGDHLVLYSDADPRIAARVLADLERFRDLFARLSPGLDLRSPAPVRFVAFRDARSFAPYKVGVEARGTRILGQFVRHSDAHYLLLDVGTRLEETYSVAFHEFTHFLVTHNFPGAPLWLNEGLAEYYGTFDVVDVSRRGPWEELTLPDAAGDEGDRRPDLRAVVGRPIVRHLLFLLAESNRVGGRTGPIRLGLDALLEVDASVSGHGPEAVGRFYAASWALTHYLLSGDDERLDRTAAYLGLLARGEEAEDAFEEAFEQSLEDMEEKIVRHLEELLAATRRAGSGEALGALYGVGLRVSPDDVKRIRVERARPADVLTHLGDFVLHVGALDFAEGHYDEALVHDSRHAAAHVGLASVYDHRGFWHQAELLYRDAQRLGIDRPSRLHAEVAALAYLRYGRHSLELESGVPSSGVEAGRQTLEDGAFERARASLERAVDIDPHYATAQQLLAAAHLLQGGDAERGLRAALAAGELLPMAVKPLVLETHLRLRLGQFGRAEWLIEGALTERGDPLIVQTLREESELQRLVQAAEAAFEAGDDERGLQLLDRAVSAVSDPARRERLEEELARRSSDGER